MSLTRTDEQQTLQEVLRSLLARKSPQEMVLSHSRLSDGFDRVLWQQLGSEIGLQGIVIPEELGGAGYGQPELMVAMEEMGRSLLCAPYLSTVVLAAQALLESGDETARQQFVPAIASGDLVATLAVAEESGRWTPEAIRTTASRVGSGWQLNGTKVFVLDGASADLILVAARVGDDVGLFAVDAGSTGLEREDLETLDPTRKQARITLQRTPAQLVGDPSDGWQVVERVLALAGIALGAEQVGTAARSLEMAVEYAKTREQFGRPIGSFQAIKHKCADMLLEVELARAAVRYAASTEGQRDLFQNSALIQALCSEAVVFVATECIQVLGGIGFTWEHQAHLYFRRARSTEVLLGTPNQQRRRVADLLQW